MITCARETALTGDIVRGTERDNSVSISPSELSHKVVGKHIQE